MIFCSLVKSGVNCEYGHESFVMKEWFKFQIIQILKMEKLSSIRKCRNLTLIGKTTIIKTLMISKIIHILLSLPRPSEESFKDIENTFLTFSWQDKLPKVRISTLGNLTGFGGLQLSNIRKIGMIIKASWVKRMFKSDEGWASIPKCYVTNMIYTYGDVFLQKKNLFAIHLGESLYNVFIIYTLIIPLKA